MYLTPSQVNAAFARNPVSSAEQAAIQASLDNGALGQLVGTIDGYSGAAPAGSAPGARALFSTGKVQLANGETVDAWHVANQLVSESQGSLYTINQTASRYHSHPPLLVKGSRVESGGHA